MGHNQDRIKPAAAALFTELRGEFTLLEIHQLVKALERELKRAEKCALYLEWRNARLERAQSDPSSILHPPSSPSEALGLTPAELSGLERGEFTAQAADWPRHKAAFARMRADLEQWAEGSTGR